MSFNPKYLLPEDKKEEDEVICDEIVFLNQFRYLDK